VYIGKNLISSAFTTFPFTPDIWLQAQLPFCIIAAFPSANSDIESDTVFEVSDLGSTVEFAT